MTNAVLVDTCTIINFAVVNRLDLLEAALDGFGRWTETVVYETNRSAWHWPNLAADSIAGWLGAPLIPDRADDAEAVFQLQRQLGGTGKTPHAHLGEAESIHIILRYPEFADAVLLTDDRDAADLAAKRGIQVWTTTTVLSRVHTQGHIGCPAAYELLRDMVTAGRRPHVPANHHAVC